MGATDELSREHRGFLDTRYFASLDGLRCLSIVAVVWHHTAGAVPGYFARGHLGVELFFTISGFLITTLLLREREKSGRVSLPDFYLRRTLRIFPLYYAVLAVYAALVLLVRPGSPSDVQARDGFFHHLPYFATYTSNWFVDLGSGPRVIFYFAWSLATEEQFYLLWPWVVALGKGWRLPVFAAVALAGVGQAALLLAAAGVLPAGGLAVHVLTSIAPPICLGCLLACCLHYRPGFRAAFRVLGAPWSAPAALGLLVLAAAAPGTPNAVIYLLMACLVGACCVRRRGPLSALFDNRVARYVGGISYGMYLLHMLALNAARRVIPAPARTPLATFAATLALTVLAAGLAYRFYELPFLRLKQRFSAARTPASHPPLPVSAAPVAPFLPCATPASSL